MKKRLTLALTISCSFAARADDSALASQLTNPVADLISIPIQVNYDSGFGSDDGYRYTMNIQPVIPFELNADWNIISRTILPLVKQNDIAGNSGSQSGTGDILQSIFFSPKDATANGWIWGAGPVFLLPTASDEMLGSEQWGAGPTAVLLKIENGWTYGALANHMWSYAGKDERADINATFLQPFLSYNKQSWTYTIQTESSYDWENQQWSVPINGMVSKLIRIQKLPVSLAFGARYWADSPEHGAEGWGGRIAVTTLLPN